MVEIYFKNQVKYMSGRKASDYSYYKLTSDGKIIHLSMSKRTISSPQSLILPKGFEMSTKEEFDKKLKELL